MDLTEEDYKIHDLEAEAEMEAVLSKELEDLIAESK